VASNNTGAPMNGKTKVWAARRRVLARLWVKRHKILAICLAAALLLAAAVPAAGFAVSSKIKGDYLSAMHLVATGTKNNLTDDFLGQYDVPAGDTREALLAIVGLLAGNVTYRPDPDDYPFTPDEFLKKGGGDCEDFAVFAAYALAYYGVPVNISVWFSLYGHAFNSIYDNESGEWQDFDLLGWWIRYENETLGWPVESYEDQNPSLNDYFTNKSYFHPTILFNHTVGEHNETIKNPAENATTRKYAKASNVFGDWFREEILHPLLKPFYSREEVTIFPKN